MDKNSILEFNNKESVSDVLNELLRSGAQKLIHNAVEAELREFMSQHQGVTEDGKVSVIRKGYLPKSSQPKAKETIHEIWQAETIVNAERAFELFI